MGTELVGGRKVTWSCLGVLPSAARKRQEKSSAYHRETKQRGNQSICEQVRQEISCVLGFFMYVPKRGEITPAEDAGCQEVPSPSCGSVLLTPLGAADKPVNSSLLSCFCS